MYEKIYPFLRSGGPAISPFNAWVHLKGLETLPLRIRAHSEAALFVADFLEKQQTVEKVLYTGLKSHPQHDLAMRQQGGLGRRYYFVACKRRARLCLAFYERVEKFLHHRQFWRY